MGARGEEAFAELEYAGTFESNETQVYVPEKTSEDLIADAREAAKAADLAIANAAEEARITLEIQKKLRELGSKREG